MSPAHFSDSPQKRAVRNLWNTPLLKYLHTTYGYRYRYLGLPGVDLLDIQLWRDMIDEVTAFEVRTEPDDDDPDGRKAISELRRNMQVLDIPGYAYFGSLEEVVILGKDYDGTPYTQENVVTLYNLDFCDEIASKVDTEERGKQVWRFEAIRKILSDQKQCFERQRSPSTFIILLTVRDQIGCRKLQTFLSRNLFQDASNYLDTCNSIRAIPTTGRVLGNYTWALKLFLYNTLRHYMSNPHISALFFPVVKYYGRPVNIGSRSIKSPMLHWMIICRFEEATSPTPIFMPVDFLSQVTSVRARNEELLVWEPELGEPSGIAETPLSDRWFASFERSFLRVQTNVTSITS